MCRVPPAPSPCPWRALALLVLSSQVAAGCAHYSAKPLDTRHDASAVVEQREVDGLYVAVKDLSQPRDSLQYFDRNLLSHGYVPVMLLLELDRNASSVFDVRREDLQVCLRDGRRLSTVDPLAVADDVSFSHIRSTVGFLLLFPGFFIASSVRSANEQLEVDYRMKAVESVRINPNMRSFRGVVFFQVPEDAASFTMEDAFVEMKVYKQGAGGVIGKCIEFPVHFGR